ncbi:polyphosphate kinase 2 [Ahrensia kielensis]|uniref:ADP/GDP-polyphosphate phosphotransferase n=1 Tax=Ahrensia kielensis TaxID=76980 RepID=A0ABU9T1J4_9HYPH|nr:polyphosphate kinase 2 [Ahrensia kielensis]
MNTKNDSRAITISFDGKDHVFDIDDPKMPDWVEDNAMIAGGYPYDKKLKRSDYEDELEALQEELVKLKSHMVKTGERMIIVFEGRDAAGKGGTINVLTDYLNPRETNVIALSKPTETEQGQWYFQRYVKHFPTSGEITIYDRSWYNRGGVEPVMGFCTPEQHEKFLFEVPGFEKVISDEGIHFFKFWLNIGRATQLERFHDRRHSKLKHWKLSDIDIVGMSKWDDYSNARDQMIKATHTDNAPWNIVRYNDKRRGRLEVLRHVLSNMEYEGKSEKVIGKANDKIIGQGYDFIEETNRS